VSYGARAINEGGWQSVPKLAFPGGALIGCSAGFVNVPRIKGSHTAMKSGMLAAEAIVAAIANGREQDELAEYDAAVRESWIAKELKLVQNAQPLVAKFGGALGTVLAGTDMWARVLKVNPLWRHEAPQGQRAHDARRPVPADPIPQAGRRDQLRPADLGGVLLHQPRGRPALPPRAQGSDRPDARSTCRYTRGRKRVSARPGSTSSSPTTQATRAFRSTPRTASTARPATSRTRRRTSNG